MILLCHWLIKVIDFKLNMAIGNKDCHFKQLDSTKVEINGKCGVNCIRKVWSVGVGKDNVDKNWTFSIGIECEYVRFRNACHIYYHGNDRYVFKSTSFIDKYGTINSGDIISILFIYFDDGCEIVEF